MKWESDYAELVTSQLKSRQILCLGQVCLQPERTSTGLA